MLLRASPAKGLPGAMAAPSPGEISVGLRSSIVLHCDEGGTDSVRASM